MTARIGLAIASVAYILLIASSWQILSAISIIGASAAVLAVGYFVWRGTKPTSGRGRTPLVALSAIISYAAAMAAVFTVTPVIAFIDYRTGAGYLSNVDLDPINGTFAFLIPAMALALAPLVARRLAAVRQKSAQAQ